MGLAAIPVRKPIEKAHARHLAAVFSQGQGGKMCGADDLGWQAVGRE